MKTWILTAVASTLLVAAAPALAGRDEVLVRKIEETMAAKRAAQMESAKQQQTGQPGPVNEAAPSDKAGPTTDEGTSTPKRLQSSDRP